MSRKKPSVKIATYPMKRLGKLAAESEKVDRRLRFPEPRHWEKPL
jgi:hypothetical protein